MIATETKLDQFTRDYIECALWSSTDEEGNPLDNNYGLSDIAPDALATMIRHCASFQAENQELLDDLESSDENNAPGHDFWLTRNRHGAGFWDGDYPDEIGEKLTDAAHAYGEVYLYVGDDGRIYC